MIGDRAQTHCKHAQWHESHAMSHLCAQHAQHTAAIVEQAFRASLSAPCCIYCHQWNTPRLVAGADHAVAMRPILPIAISMLCHDCVTDACLLRLARLQVLQDGNIARWRSLRNDALSPGFDVDKAC